MVGLVDVLRAGGSIAGLGGLAIASVIWLFRAVIARDFFPQLTKQHAFEVIRLIVRCTFGLGVLGIVAWIAPQLLTIQESKQGTTATPTLPPLSKTLPAPASPPLPSLSQKPAANRFDTLWAELAPDSELPGVRVFIPKDWKQGDADSIPIAFQGSEDDPKDRFLLYLNDETKDFGEFVSTATGGDQAKILKAKWSSALRKSFVDQDIGGFAKILKVDLLPLHNTRNDSSVMGEYEAFWTVEPPSIDDDRYLYSLYIIAGADQNSATSKTMSKVHYVKISCQVPAAFKSRRMQDCDDFFSSIYLFRN